jgi:hypothetical protein
MAVLKDLIVTGPARATGNVYGSSFVKAGGTSSQFLKADGSVDSNTYSLSSHNHSGTYKPVQTAVSDPTASGTSTSFIATASQNANGVITVTKASLPTASTTVAGITKVGASGGAADYSHTHTFSSITSRGEAFLTWGGQNLMGTYAPIDAAMVGNLGANRTAFVNASTVTVEYSRDNGTTWTNYGASDSSKTAFFTNFGGSFVIGKSTTANKATADCLLRVTLNTASSVYTVLNKFIIYLSTSGCSGCWCSIDCRTQTNYTNSTETWVNFANKVGVSGWSGYNVINTAGITTYGNMTDSQYGQVRFTFGCTGNTSSYAGLTVNGVNCYGGVGWTTPSTMAKTGHLYSYDTGQNATFPADITATKFVKRGGTSSQFLKADGSVDTNSYALASAIPTVNNATLTLSGGGGLTVSTDPTFTANASSNKTITITHPSATAYASGFYKVTVNDTGHVTAATAVTAADVTTLINGTYIPVASSALGSATKPVYLSGVSSFSECSTYAGGTKVTLNSTDKGASTASFYAPTGSGTSGQYLKSNGSNNAPIWADLPVAGTSQAGIVQLGTTSGTAAAGDHTHNYIPTAAAAGSTTKPIYLSAQNTFSECSTYAGGTAVTLNGDNKGGTTASFYAPTTAGDAGKYLKSNGSGAPAWADLPADSDTKVTQTKTASSNTSWRPIILGAKYAANTPSTSTAFTFDSPTTDTTYAAHLAALAPSTGILAVVGLKKFNSSGKLADNSDTNLWNTNGGVVTIGASGGPAAFDHDHSGVYVPNPSTAGTAGQYLKMGSSTPEWANLPADSDTKVKQSVSTSNTVYRRLLLTYNSTAAASGTITADAENIAYYSNSIMANPGTGEILATKVRATSDLYVGSATTSQCHQQYDATNKCLKFLFD